MIAHEWPCPTCGATNRDDAVRRCTAQAIECSPLRPVACSGLAEMAAALAVYAAARAVRSRGATEVVN